MKGLLRAKAMSAVYETPQCPIVGVMARIALEKTRGVPMRLTTDWYHREFLPKDEIPIPKFCPSTSTRDLFAQIWGFSPDAQILIENAIIRGDMNYVSQMVVGHPDVYRYASRYIEVT
jgi:hypothetical protein